MTVQDIVGEVLDKNGIPHEWRLKQPLKNWVYLVQYNETDLALSARRLHQTTTESASENSETAWHLLLASSDDAERAALVLIKPDDATPHSADYS